MDHDVSNSGLHSAFPHTDIALNLSERFSQCTYMYTLPIPFRIDSLSLRVYWPGRSGHKVHPKCYRSINTSTCIVNHNVLPGSLIVIPETSCAAVARIK